MLYDKLKNFLVYFNDFYGKEGIYPSGRFISMNDIMNAISEIEKEIGVYSFEGDSHDREMIRDYVFSDAELKKMYS